MGCWTISTIYIHHLHPPFISTYHQISTPIKSHIPPPRHSRSTRWCPPKRYTWVLKLREYYKRDHLWTIAILGKKKHLVGSKPCRWFPALWGCQEGLEMACNGPLPPLERHMPRRWDLLIEPANKMQKGHHYFLLFSKVVIFQSFWCYNLDEGEG
jgi:hypothetical protein